MPVGGPRVVAAAGRGCAAGGGVRSCPACWGGGAQKRLPFGGRLRVATGTRQRGSRQNGTGAPLGCFSAAQARAPTGQRRRTTAACGEARRLPPGRSSGPSGFQPCAHGRCLPRPGAGQQSAGFVGRRSGVFVRAASGLFRGKWDSVEGPEAASLGAPVAQDTWGPGGAPSATLQNANVNESRASLLHVVALRP